MASAIKKLVVLAVSGAGVYLLFANESSHDLRRRSAKFLRDGSRAARWVSDGLEDAAERLDSSHNSDYVNDEWQKLDHLRAIND